MNTRLKSARYLTSLFILVACLAISAYSNAALDEVNLNLSGTVIEKTCGIDSTLQNKLVEFDKVSIKQLLKVGDQSTPKAFQFDFRNCPANGAVTITFTGQKDTSDTQLLALDNISGKAENVAIEIRDKDKNRIALDKKSQQFITDTNGRATAVFYANYIATKLPVKVGAANAKMQFSIEYE